MGKFLKNVAKFTVGVAAVTLCAAGAYYVYKKVKGNGGKEDSDNDPGEESGDLDSFDDSAADDDDVEEDAPKADSVNRKYVNIVLDWDQKSKKDSGKKAGESGTAENSADENAESGDAPDEEPVSEESPDASTVPEEDAADAADSAEDVGAGEDNAGEDTGSEDSADSENSGSSDEEELKSSVTELQD